MANKNIIKIKKINTSINCLKVLTMFLIINSHSDVLYPSIIRFMASGGAIGNELFFLISGYLFSEKRDVCLDVIRRFIRLYIPTFIMILIMTIFGEIHIDGLVTAARIIVWPTYFWFVGAIFLYSVLMYWLIKCEIDRKERFVIFSVLLIAIDILLYIIAIPDKTIWVIEDYYFAFVPFRIIYSFFSFVFGYYLKKNKKLVEKLCKLPVIPLAILMFMFFYVFKYLLSKNIVAMPFQILSQPLTILSSFFIFIIFLKDKKINYFFVKQKTGKMINNISRLSLETYLVQFLIISMIASLQIVFPINLLITVIVIICCAKLLQIIVKNTLRIVAIFLSLFQIDSSFLIF